MTDTQITQEDRIEQLRSEIRRCDEAIENGSADSWWHIDRDRLRLELDQITNRDSAAHLATRTDATPVAWMPMTSSPWDEPILAAIKVNHREGHSWWERHIIVIDSETGTISDMDFHHGWEAEDYECWQPLPAAPDATNTHPPATDVAALVEQRCPSCGVKFREIADVDAHIAALAPFTKGQNDG